MTEALKAEEKLIENLLRKRIENNERKRVQMEFFMGEIARIERENEQKWQLLKEKGFKEEKLEVL